ncbi:four helix bundle protein [Candidatus Nomurabacteria bacterium]|nr:four helix bundle protein [Candidatus Saccharibacteria bacterium]MCA9312817.1 four helix bundle protein [Candidatus Saccharibacteria bacterium]MCB9822257.1 four helix bundle protein [Candidatus Nomurabacteria bacterium]
MGKQNELKAFQDLTVWQESRKLFFIIYKLTKQFPKEEVFSSVSQMRRSSMSISSNIAEGFGRSSIADKLHFYIMARGSLTELQNQIILTGDVGLITAENIKIALEQAEITHKLVVGLIKVTERRKQ